MSYVSSIDGLAVDSVKMTRTDMPLTFELPKLENSNSGQFVEVLNSIIEDFEYKEKLTQDMLSGKDVDVHSLMIAGAQVDLMGNLASTVATKVATAYQTLMNMQI